MLHRLHPLLLTFLAAVSFLLPAPARAAGSIRINVSPTVLLADGVSTAAVTAEVRSSSGRPVRDGTEVRFYTTAGSITDVAFTSAGVARATLTSSAVPQAANISVSVGIDQAVTTVPMVSRLVEANVGGRVLKVTGKYVAFSEDRKFIQSDDQVKVKFRGVEIQANSVQVDLNRNVLVALGKVQITSGEKVKVGERLWLDLKSFESFIVAVGTRQWFSAYGLTDLPERPKNLNANFDLMDLTDSKLIWVSRSASYIIDDRVQMPNARAYVGGIKSIRMPFHEADLDEGFGGGDRYIGIGTDGINLNLPLYVAMSPSASTAFQVNYGSSRGGIGAFTRQRGLSIDVVQKYGFSGSSEGEAAIVGLTTPDRIGLFWNHTQRINSTTRLVADIQFPQHRDLYGSINLTSGLPIGNLRVATSVSQLRQNPLSHTLSVGFETKPKMIAGGKLAITGETSYFQRNETTTRFRPGGTGRGIRFNLPPTQYETVGVRVRPAQLSLRRGLTLDSSLTLRGVMGNNGRSGFGPTGEVQLRQNLPRNGSFSIGLNYNGLPSITDILPTNGKARATLNLMYPITDKIRISAFGNLGLDSNNRHSVLQMSYRFSPRWSFSLLHTFFQFNDYSDFDYQIGIAREIGGRNLGLYWSRREHRWIIEFGAGRF